MIKKICILFLGLFCLTALANTPQSWKYDPTLSNDHKQYFSHSLKGEGQLFLSCDSKDKILNFYMTNKVGKKFNIKSLVGETKYEFKLLVDKRFDVERLTSFFDNTDSFYVLSRNGKYGPYYTTGVGVLGSYGAVCIGLLYKNVD